MKTLSLVTGLVVLVLAAGALLASFGEGSLTAHMIVHMAIVAVAAPLLAFGMDGTRFAPHRRMLRMTPMRASIIELVVVWFWHVPALRRAADASLPLTLIEQTSFLAAGLLLWIICFRPGEEGEGRLAGTIGLLFTSMHMTLLGVLLALSPRPLYAEGDVTCFGIPLSAAADQHLGGVVMLVVGAFSYLIGGVALLSGLLRESHAAPAKDPPC